MTIIMLPQMAKTPTRRNHDGKLVWTPSAILGISLCLVLSCLSSSFASTMALSADVNPSSLSSMRKSAVIVGGGPVGLATALTLSNPPHSYDVTIVEQASVEQYDPTKAYLYNVNPRGQGWMKENFPSALEKLRIRGSGGSMSRITIVPADPSQPIPGQKDLARYDTKKNNPIAAAKNDESTENDKETKKETTNNNNNNDNDNGNGSGIVGLDNQSFWMPRHSMICLLEDEIQEQEEARKSTQGKIELKKGRTFTSLTPMDDGTLQVSVEEVASGNAESYRGALVVAADGYNSAVREWLADETQNTWLQSKPKKFRVKRWKSPASGLRMKVIQMPPGFSIPDADGSPVKTENERTYAIRGKYTGFKTYMSLGLLPVKDPSMIRPANVITRPSHVIWKITDGPSAKKWFTDAFPRFNWDDHVDDKEWERFAKATGTTFPFCQYSPGLQVSSPDAKCGVALVGDAAHAFPPDIGQGINAGLCDVVAFDRALRGKDIITGEDGETPKSLGAALQEYERVQAPQIRALIRIARFGFPYQYRQSLLRDRIGRLFLTFNIAFRLSLNKLSFGFIPTSSIVLLQNPNLTYRQVMRRADLTTAGLSAAALTLGWKLFGTSLKKLVGFP